MLKEAVLHLNGLFLGIRVEDAGICQEPHYALGVELKILVAALVVEEALEFQFMVDIAEDDVTVVFGTGAVPVDAFVGSDAKIVGLLGFPLLFYLFRVSRAENSCLFYDAQE